MLTSLSFVLFLLCLSSLSPAITASNNCQGCVQLDSFSFEKVRINDNLTQIFDDLKILTEATLQLSLCMYLMVFEVLKASRPLFVGVSC